MSARHTPLPELHALPTVELAGAVCRRLGLAGEVLDEVVVLHLQTLVTAAEWNVPEMLTEQFRWERNRLAGAGVTLRYRELHDAVLGELDAHLDRITHARLRVLYSRAQVADRETPISAPTPLGATAQRYLDAALAGDAPTAVAIVRRALAGGTSTSHLVRDVLQPAQVETGRLWEAGELSVSEEHRVTDITTRCLALVDSSLLRPLHDVAQPRVLAATLGAEAHDLGLRMLGEVMADGGWYVDHLGAGVPVDDLAAHVRRTRPDVVAVSVTLTAHLPLVAALVLALRRDEDLATRVLVGGRALAGRAGLARVLGADGSAEDPESALAQCREWIGRDTRASHAARSSSGGLDGLARRYRTEVHHVAGALELLAAQSGVSRDELAARLQERTG